MRAQRPALFPLASFARLRGSFWPGAAAARRAGDGALTEAQDVAKHDGGPLAWHGGLPSETPRGVTGGTEPETSTQGVLAVYHLRKSYKARRVVEDVSMTVRRGEVVGLLGPNGAGKTTLFYMITGLIRPDSGRIELDGHDVTRLPMYRRARLGIGYLPQEARFSAVSTVEDNIRAVLEIVEPDKLKRAGELEGLLDEFDLKSLRKTPSIALSGGGERRRCEIARALAGRLVLHAFLDVNRSPGSIPSPWAIFQLLVQHLKRRGIGVLVTDHNVRETLGLIDRAYILHSGRVLVEGTSGRDCRRPQCAPLLSWRRIPALTALFELLFFSNNQIAKKGNNPWLRHKLIIDNC